MRQKRRWRGVNSLYFKRISMHGFKSFAEPVTIDFHEGITCIVGPNGSGKSNISDAIRWVLGEQSPKALRGGKMDEVIFAGTANRKSRGMAEVTLVIDNSENILPIDYNEVAITRRMYRSGESEYLINNNHCRLKDIRELIMDTGIGVDGYSIIGQGKIADIVSNKPESRREIFEEAAGIVMYRTKKAEVERKLSVSQTNLERVNDIVSEIEGRIDTLRSDSEKAAEYLKLRERYKELEINITLKNVEGLELKAEYLKDEIAEAAAAIEELREEKAEIDRTASENKTRLESLEELTAETASRLMKAVEEMNALVNRNEIDRERLSAIEENTDRLTREIEGLEEKKERECRNAEQLERECRQLEEEERGLRSELESALSVYENQTREVSDTAAAIDEQKNKVYELSGQSQSKRAEANSLRSLQENLEERKKRLEKESGDTDKQRQDAEEAILRIEEEKKALIGTETANRESLQKLSEKYNGSLLGEKQKTKELEELRISLGQLSGRKRTMEEMEANYEGYNQAVRYLMKANLRGIHGVVADLMSVPGGYETAVETALGAAMQNVVCDDDESAKKAIRMLKEQRAGRLTFLPTASIRGGRNRDGRITGAAGFLGYGCECVEFAPKYQNIFEYLLGRTVIVDTMENAIRMSKGASGGLRFVTLEGEIVSTAGSITGGRYKNSTANLLGRKAEIEHLKQEIEKKNGQKEAAEKELAELRDLMDRTRREMGRAEEEKKQAEVARMLCENRLEMAQNVLSDLHGAAEKRESEEKRILEEQQKADQMIRVLLSEAEAAEQAMTEVTEAADLEMTAYTQKKEALDEASEAIVRARMAANSCREKKNAAEAALARVQASLSELTRDMEERERDRSEFAAQKEQITQGTGAFSGLLDEKTAEKENLERYAAELAEERASVTASVTASLSAKNALDEKMSALSDNKYNAEIRLAKNETQLEHFKDKLWEEFEVSYVQAIELRRKDFVMNNAVRESREIKGRLKELGEVNVGAIKEYEEVRERYEFLTEQRNDILEASASLSGIISDMDRTIRMKFKESFDGIVANFEQIFAELFGGGHAELRLENEANPLESGIEIIAQPPGKKLQNINLMSGGEKTMTAIALMFAVLKTKPTPFCILDEVEAALDDANIDRFADYLKKFEGIQFALVTHQRATMEHADVLYGVTMPEQGISKLISLRLGDRFEL